MSETTSFKNQNIGLTSGWSQGELTWGSPLNDDLMILDTLCQGRVKSIITSSDQQPVIIARGDAYIYALDDEKINLLQPTVRKNDIVIFRTSDINDYLVTSPKPGWKIFNSSDSTTYIYTEESEDNKYWQKESLIKTYNSFIDLPSIGTPNVLYIVNNSTIYMWNNNKLTYEKILDIITDVEKIICGDSNEEK